jgi:hypothetical protein
MHCREKLVWASTIAVVHKAKQGYLGSPTDFQIKHLYLLLSNLHQPKRLTQYLTNQIIDSKPNIKEPLNPCLQGFFMYMVTHSVDTHSIAHYMPAQTERFHIQNFRYFHFMLLENKAS